MTSEAVSVHELVKHFGKFTAVDRISFSAQKGEIFGFLGPNGAGKSTTIRMLCGIISPTSGSGHVTGLDIFTQSEEIKHRIGYMSQKFSLYEDMTPYENIRFFMGIYTVPLKKWEERTDWVLEMTRLGSARNRLTRDLPQGLRQRLALGCALLHEPGVLFLDEPTSGVDPITRKHFWSFIRELTTTGVTVFVTTHYMDEAQHCDKVVIINEGRIVAHGSPLAIVHDIFPQRQDATLNDVFIHLMSRGA